MRNSKDKKKNITKLQEKQQRTGTKVKVKVLVLIIWFNKNWCHDNDKEVWVGTKNRYMNVNKRKRRKGPKTPIVKAKKIKKNLKSIWPLVMSSRKWWWCKAKSNDILFFSFAKYKWAQHLLSLILN